VAGERPSKGSGKKKPAKAQSGRPRRIPEPEFLIIGRVLGPRGVKGELRVQPMTEFPDRFAEGEKAYLTGQAVTIERSFWHKGRVVLKLSGTDSYEAAEKLQGRFLEVRLAELPSLEEGRYYQYQMIGLEVWTTKGELVGHIQDVMSTASNDVYIVGDGRQTLIPAIEDVVVEVDLKTGRVVVEPIEGLLG